eukprot:13085825-Alexandrium_andersonii.AAC.1
MESGSCQPLGPSQAASGSPLGLREGSPPALPLPPAPAALIPTAALPSAAGEARTPAVASELPGPPLQIASPDSQR